MMLRAVHGFIRWLGVSRPYRHRLSYPIHHHQSPYPFCGKILPRQTRAILGSEAHPASLDKSPFLLGTFFPDILTSPCQPASPIPTPSNLISGSTPQQDGTTAPLPGFLVGERWRKAHRWISRTYSTAHSSGQDDDAT
ncbi:hypothetical protein V8C34DRAFT_274633 [Trichoderma compactum]